MKPIEGLEVFQDVSFEYPHSTAPKLRQGLAKRISPPWCFDADWEKEVRTRVEEGVEIVAFSRRSYDNVNSAYLCLYGTSLNKWTIPNVVPQDWGIRFTIRQYNDILNEFIQRILIPELSSQNIDVTVSERFLSLENLMSNESIRHLHSFMSIPAVCADVSHPHDEERLCQLILSLHENDPAFNADLFCRWLRDVRSWREEDAQKLATRIDQGLVLLKIRSKYQPA